MKGVIYLLLTGFVLVVLTGCYTIPRHYSEQVEIIYYVPVDPPYSPDPIIDYLPPPPSPSIYYPPSTENNPDRNRTPEKPKDSYGQRDPLQGGSKRGNGTIMTEPPVRTPVKKNSDTQ